MRSPARRPGPRLARLGLVLLSAVVSTSAVALVLGGSNLPLYGYPEHDCSKPTRPYKPYSFSNQWEVDSYNMDVERFNRDLEQFGRCIDEYVENGKNDMKRIREQIDAAIADYNSL